MYQLSTTLRNAINAGNPQRVLLEFTDYSPHKYFSNEDILIDKGLKLTEEFNSETDLTIGLCPSAEIQFDMLNDHNQLTSFQFGKFIAYLGARIDSGTPSSSAKTKTFTEYGKSELYEFAPLGTFIAERPDIVRKSIISVTANDQMVLFEKEMPSRQTLNLVYPTTLATLLQKMCAHLSVTRQSTTFLNSSLEVTSEPEQFNGATMRDVLGWIAEAACSNARFNRSGKLEFFWFNTVNKTYDEHNYKEFTPAWYATQAVNGLHIRNADSTAEYKYGTGTNAYLIQDNPFLRQPDPVE